MNSYKHPLFVLITEEHLEIKKMAHDLTSDIELKSKLLEKLRAHHNMEEKALFSQLAKHPQICEGGPMCTYFFDAQITSPPILQAESITGTPLTVPSELSELWNNQSPLKIPAGEHLALQHILNFSSSETLAKNLNLFIQLMESNFQKEEECLFHVCSRLLEEGELDKIYGIWTKH